MKHKLIFALSLVVSCFFISTLHASTKVWEPASGHKQIPIWPAGKIPDPLQETKPETVKIMSDQFVAGKPWAAIFDVSQPTMTIYSPKKYTSDAAIIVIPGGAFKVLAIDLEGTEICDWITSKGMTCVLLKYRVPNSGPTWNDNCQCDIQSKSPIALQDLQRTFGLVRLNASKYHINPNKIGVLGSSAGGYLVAEISTNFSKRSYTPIDDADKESCRPDFAIAMYPGHMEDKPKQFVLNKDIHFTQDSPSTFLLQAQNDPDAPINDSLLYYIGLKNAGVAVEMHLYAEGGHAFGIRETKLPITKWPILVETWLKTIKVLDH